MAPFDLPGALRRIRRAGDLSQRELAVRLGVSKSTVAAAEAGQRTLAVEVLARAADLSGLRLALLDTSGVEVAGMASQAVRDRAGRRFPAHLDTRYGDEDWWHGDQRYSREQPWYTFDRLRCTRDDWRDRQGVPDDHQAPAPGDAPEERRAARTRAARRRRAEELQLRRAARGSPDAEGGEFTCDCPPGCDSAREVLAEVHVEGCPCRCDIA